MNYKKTIKYISYICGSLVLLCIIVMFINLLFFYCIRKSHPGHDLKISITKQEFGWFRMNEAELKQTRFGNEFRPVSDDLSVAYLEWKKFLIGESDGLPDGRISAELLGMETVGSSGKLCGNVRESLGGKSAIADVVILANIPYGKGDMQEVDPVYAVEMVLWLQHREKKVGPPATIIVSRFKLEDGKWKLSRTGRLPQERREGLIKPW
ncbi:MAG: hypothetical protein PHV34_22645 [Verrucomicrobiae bacterium]|nr:hypothetical protein [Verrucomicrobiae bacterium]